MNDTTFIVAGNFAEYNDYISRKIDAGLDVSNYAYLDNVSLLMGRNEIKGFYIGSYKNRADIQEISEKINIIKLGSGQSKSKPKSTTNIPIGFIDVIDGHVCAMTGAGWIKIEESTM